MGHSISGGASQAAGQARTNVAQAGAKYRVQPASTTTPPLGFDQTSPGVGEQQFNNQQSKFNQPGAGPQWWQQNQGWFDKPTNSQGFYGQNQSAFAAPGQGEQFWNQVQGNLNFHPGASNRADQAYDQFQQQTPMNLDPYYDQAAKKTTGRINNQFAARGQYNSSAATDSIGQAMASLGAEQANREGDYGLNRASTAGNLGASADLSSRGASANELGWNTGLGNLSLGAQGAGLNRVLGGSSVAQGADTSSLARMLGGGNMALGSDSADLGRLVGGMDASRTAQNLRDTRVQGAFNNISGPANSIASLANGAYGNISGGDMQLLDAVLSGKLGAASTGLNYDLGQQGRFFGDIGAIADIASKFSKAGAPAAGQGQ